MSGGFMYSLFKKKSDEEEPTNFGLARVFKYEELKKATNSFSTELGIGGFGTVYLGTLRDGQMVAVKVLHNHNPKRLQQFVNEVIVLSRLRHKNLVTLHGCTNPRGKELLLVYEYVPNSTVEDHLHGQRSDLTLAVRVQIAVETAEALVYLHALDPPLIHRDVKTSNIMLDHGFHVKVGDLGLCRLLPWDTTQVSTVPQGTMGYRDPEYDRTLILTVKSDVYSFGVVLAELISGKKAVDVYRAPDNIYLAGLAHDMITNNQLDDFADPKLGYNSDIRLERVINSLAELAVKCMHSTGIMRPTMKQVLTELKQIDDELQQIGGLSAPLQELGDESDDSLINGNGVSSDDSLIDGGEATIEDPDNGGSIYRPDRNIIILLNNTSLYFDIGDLMRASADKMGKGELGTTYRATLKSGPVVILKRLTKINAFSEKGFSQQMQLLGQVKHENLVEIIAFYGSNDQKLVVYENVLGVSLYKLLHINKGAREGPLNWAARLSIVKDMARGLAHLHNALPSLEVPHANLKSSNVIVLQNNHRHPPTYNAKLTDFGFLPGFQVEKLQIGFTPELRQEKKLTQKADIYCFGLLLLEVLTGKAMYVAEFVISDFFSFLVNISDLDMATDLLDSEIAAEVDGHGEEIVMLIKIALECTSEEPERRPEMSEVVQRIEEIEEPNREEGSRS